MTHSIKLKRKLLRIFFIEFIVLVSGASGAQTVGTESPKRITNQGPIKTHLAGLLVLGVDPFASKTQGGAAARQLCKTPQSPALTAEQVDPAHLTQLRSQLAHAPAGQQIVSKLPSDLIKAEDIQVALNPFLGRAIDKDLTQRIVDAVVKLTTEQNRFLVDVYFPAQANQQVRDGILVLTVQPATVGRVMALGQKHTPAQDIECRIALQSDQWVDLKQIESDIKALNDSSRWRTTRLQPEFRAGERPGSTDIVLYTQDENPERYTVGLDNTGNRTSDLQRVRAGYSLGHVGGRFDHQLDYHFAASPDFQKFRSHTLSYGFPLSGGDKLSLRADYISTDVMLAGHTFHSKGDNAMLNAEWSRSLAASVDSGNAKTGEIYGGAEIKRIGSSLAFGQTAVSDHTVQVAQLYGGWRNDWQHSRGAGQTDLRLTWSPGKLIGLNDDASYNTVRQGAKARYWRINAGWGQNFELPLSVAPRWQISTRLTAQLANAPLLASERMGLTGIDGVRGYYQDSLYADAGVVGTLELQSPRWPVPMGLISGAEWQFIAFADAGQSRNATTETIADLNITARNAKIASQGLGLRLSKARQFHVRADVARRNNGLSTDKRWLWHVSAQIAF